MPASIIHTMNQKPEKKKRAAPISYRPPAGYETTFSRLVRRSGKTTSGFITSLWISKEDLKDVDLEKKITEAERLRIHILNELKELKDEWRETNHRLQDRYYDCGETLDQINHQLLMLRQKTMKDMGRKG